MATVHSYKRFSHISQAKGDSERRQDDAAKKFCLTHGHTLSDLTLFDKGKSGFRGNKQKALLAFLKAIEDGLVKSGDILLVENLDRLGRKGIRKAQDLTNSIFNAGVHIAILMPMEKIYQADDENNIGNAIELAALAYQAWIYSKNLSDRVKSFHANARKRAIDKKEIINSGPVPSWLERKNKTYKTIPEAVKAIQYLFKRAIEGAGGNILCKEMNEQFPIISRSKKSTNWNKTYIRQILQDKRVLGEYQSHIMDDDSNRVKTGDAIKEYYPAIIDEQTWTRANQAVANRRIERGPSGSFINLFTGLVFHAVDKCSCHIYTYQQTRADGTKIIYRRLKSYNAVCNMAKASKETVDIDQAEKAIIGFMKELDLNTIFVTDITAIELKNETHLLEKKSKRLEQLQTKLEDDAEDIDLLLPTMKKLKTEIAESQATIEKLKATQINASGAGATAFKQLDDSSDRQTIREALKQLLRKIVILPVKLGKQRNSKIVCLYELEFINGTRRTIISDGKSYISYDDACPSNPPLIERNDIKQVVKGIVGAMKSFA